MAMTKKFTFPLPEPATVHSGRVPEWGTGPLGEDLFVLRKEGLVILNAGFYGDLPLTPEEAHELGTWLIAASTYGKDLDA